MKPYLFAGALAIAAANGAVVFAMLLILWAMFEEPPALEEAVR